MSNVREHRTYNVVTVPRRVPCPLFVFKVIVAMGPWSCLAEEWFNIPVPMQV